MDVKKLNNELEYLNNVKILLLHFCKPENQFSFFLWNLQETVSWGFMRGGRRLGENLSYVQGFTVGSADYLLQKSRRACFFCLFFVFRRACFKKAKSKVYPVLVNENF